MKQAMDKLKQVARKHKKILLFLFGIALIGLITGSVFTTILSSDDKTLVKDYIVNFISKIDTHKLNYINSFKNAFLSNLIFIISIWVLGISIIGIPINLFIYFAKTFMLGFSISAFVLQYQSKGCLLALIYIFPHHIINIIIYTVLVLFSMSFSKKLFLSIKSKKTISFQNTFKRYTVILAGAILLTSLTTIIEIFLTPFLLQKILFIIK